MEYLKTLAKLVLWAVAIRILSQDHNPFEITLLGSFALSYAISMTERPYK